MLFDSNHYHNKSFESFKHAQLQSIPSLEKRKVLSRVFKTLHERQKYFVIVYSGGIVTTGGNAVCASDNSYQHVLSKEIQHLQTALTCTLYSVINRDANKLDHLLCIEKSNDQVIKMSHRPK